jgi:UDP:flavonoid glycosyltransferase YjiC (YdhE family)
VRLTGFPLWDERGVEPLPGELVRFLENGDRPVAFTPGSANVHGREFFETSVKASRLAGKRALLLTRHRDQVPDRPSADVMHVPYAPFSELLPRCAALVHHGGIGTTAQALAAGCPQVVMPLSHDQPDNGARVERLGVGRLIPPRKYKAQNIARVLDELTKSEEVGRRCTEVASRFEGVDAIGRACEEIGGLMRQGIQVAGKD